MLLRFLNFQWYLIEAFVVERHLFFEVAEWSGMLDKVRDKFY